MNTQNPTFTGKIIGSKISKTAKNWSFAHSYEPDDPYIIDNRGSIFIIVDIPSEYEIFGKGLVKIIQDTFYEKNELDALEAFDKALNIANTKIHEHASRIVTQKHETMKILNITVAILHKSVLHLSQLGENHINLIRKGAFNRIGNVKEAQTIDTQSFQKIASGDITIGDILAFSTPSLMEFVELDRFKEIVTSCYPSVAASQIKDIIHKSTRGDLAPSILIVEVNESEGPSREPLTPEQKDEPTSNPSLYYEDPITQKKSETKAQIAQKISGVHDDLYDMDPLEDYDLPPSAFEEDYDVEHLNSSGPSPLFLFIKKAQREIRKQIALIRRVLKGQEDFSKLNKLFLGLGIIIFVVLLIKISQKSPTNNPVVQENNLYDEAYSYYEQGYDIAQSSGEYQKAREFYVAALEKTIESINVINTTMDVTNASDTTQERLNNLNSLKREIQQRIDDIDQVTRISDPNVLANLTTLSETVDAFEIEQVDNGLYIFDKTSQSLYFYSFESNALTLESQTLFDSTNIVGYMITATNNNLYMYAKKGISPTILSYNDDTKQFSEIDLTYDGTIPTLSVFGSWTDAAGNSRLYGVSPDKSALFRFRISSTGLEEPANVIDPGTTQPNFANIIDFKIDGDIYILLNNGTVNKFIPSELDNTYALKTIDSNPLLSPEAFYLTEDDDNGQFIYVADEDNSRIIIYKKRDGSISKTLVSETEFQDIRDITANETNRTLYVLSGNNLISVQYN